jgi:hypothetical protein
MMAPPPLFNAIEICQIHSDWSVARKVQFHCGHCPALEQLHLDGGIQIDFQWGAVQNVVHSHHQYDIIGTCAFCN